MITINQVSIGASATVIAAVPPGTTAVVLTNTGTAPVFVGTGGGVTTANGLGVPPNGVVTIPGFPGSKGVTLYGIVASGTNPIGYCFSTTG